MVYLNIFNAHGRAKHGNVAACMVETQKMYRPGGTHTLCKSLPVPEVGLGLRCCYECTQTPNSGKTSLS